MFHLLSRLWISIQFGVQVSYHLMTFTSEIMPEKNLQTLLASMSPQLHQKQFVFVAMNESELESLRISPKCIFREDEAVTAILEKSIADHHCLNYSNTWSLITCKINSDLTAVGFLAAMSKSLADAGIAVNAVSAYFHDHLFVPSERAEEALTLLRELSTARAEFAVRYEPPIVSK